MTRTEVVVSELLTAHPVVPPQVAGPLLRALDLTRRDPVPAWITDPDVRASIEAGFLDIPDELHGDSRHQRITPAHSNPPKEQQ
ncbi:hypothetical protein [Streptomyces pacificus]|uniref:Uncharacterized protein n=1 Tax=Streptomyces pacificus TaxID=2705029 RepID=A0A6A0ANY5_9ACTN|nr:hypothetical protein [Streptomyces pacificus]GFH34348.1 hypothetical protein SCWH03_05620 [Streptomyces pacificus]